jgi:uncharacterized membrane protein YkvA (DUF1232 family)
MRKFGWLKTLRSVRTELFAIYLACRDPRTPRVAKVAALVVLGYALSPIDLIPDFIPVLGLLDDALLIPLGLLLVRALIPPAILAEARLKAATSPWLKPRNWIAAGVILALWVLALIVIAWLAWRYVAAA